MATSNRMAEYVERMRVAKLAKDAGRVTVVKARVSGAKLSMRPDLLAKQEFEPDNSRIGCESLAFQSCKLAAYALYDGNWDKASRLMVEEHCDLKMGIVKPSAVISFTMLSTEQSAPERKAYTCEQYPPVMLGTALRTYNSINNSPIAVRQECASWQKKRTPRMVVFPNPWK